MQAALNAAVMRRSKQSRAGGAPADVMPKLPKRKKDQVTKDIVRACVYEHILSKLKKMKPYAFPEGYQGEGYPGPKTSQVEYGCIIVDIGS